MSAIEQISINSLSNRWLSQSGKYFTPIWLGVTAAIIAWGWFNREQDFVTAERGLGYWLGIIGASMMLLLLTYSLRKRLKVLRSILTVKFWFQFHMTLGIVGPLCILFHSNFQLGSLNSTVALVCMLLVAGSGIAGRYIYTRIHFGLYGEKIRLQQVQADFQLLKKDLATLATSPKQTAQLDKLFHATETLISAHQNNLGLYALYINRRKAKKIAEALKAFINRLEPRRDQSGWGIGDVASFHDTAQQECTILLAVLGKLPGLQLFERLFSLWHVVHIPIFILMILTAVTHVVVVHMY